MLGRLKEAYKDEIAALKAGQPIDLAAAPASPSKRKAGAVNEDGTPRKRAGRPKKDATPKGEGDAGIVDASPDTKVKSTPKSTPRKRGRPAKKSDARVDDEDIANDEIKVEADEGDDKSGVKLENDMDATEDFV